MKIYPYLIINFLSVACCVAYAGHDYSIITAAIFFHCFRIRLIPVGY